MLTLHTLGECRVAVARVAAPPVTLAPDADRLFSLALLLAGECGRPLPRGQAAEWVWPELGPPSGRRCLRQALYRLRAAGVPVAADADHLCLARDRVAATFAARPTVAALRAGWADGTLRLGRCLPGWTPAGEAIGAWAEGYRERVEGAARRALAAALDEVAGVRPADASLAAEVARALLVLDPAHPGARRLVAARDTPEAPAPDLPDALDEPLGLLDARWAAARAGAGGLVVLAGPSGGGPSALLAAFAARATGGRVVWAEGAGGASVVAALARSGADSAGPVLVCLDGAERAGAAALAAVADAVAGWADVPALAVVACAGAWPRGGPAHGPAHGPAEARDPGERAARRWGSRLGEVARAVADGRPLLVRVGAA